MPGQNPPATPAAPTPRDAEQGFKIVDTIVDPDGIVAQITERERDGRISFGIFREYTQLGVTKKTTYMNSRHIPAIRRLCNDLAERLEAIEDRSRAARRSPDRGG